MSRPITLTVIATALGLVAGCNNGPNEDNVDEAVIALKAEIDKKNAESASGNAPHQNHIYDNTVRCEPLTPYSSSGGISPSIDHLKNKYNETDKISIEDEAAIARVTQYFGLDKKVSDVSVVSKGLDGSYNVEVKRDSGNVEVYAVKGITILTATSPEVQKGVICAYASKPTGIENVGKKPVKQFSVDNINPTTPEGTYVK